MRRPDLTDLGIVALAVCGALVDPRDAGEARIGKEFVLSLVLWVLLGLLLRQMAATVAAALSERRRALTLGGVDTRAAAADAVRLERERLSEELDLCIRQALVDIRDHLATVDDDAPLVASRIHRRSREAATELRLQLGLLRSPPSEPPPPTAPAAARGPLALTAAAMAFAAVDAWAGSSLYGPEFYESSAWRLPWSGVLGLVLAATLLGRSVAPLAAAIVAAGLLVVPREAGELMVSAGFGLTVIVGGHVWSLATRGVGDARAVAVTVVLTAAAVQSRLRDDPLNAGFLGACIGAVWVLGTVVGVSRRRRSAAARRAREHEADLDAAREVAVRTERLAVARELHDVASHAIGVVAIQAAAAEVSWPTDPQAALEALETIGATAAHALDDLKHVVPGDTLGAQHDLDGLVARIRATGTTVELVRRGASEPDGVVYRIVQEGLTNAVRHAPGARVEVLIDASEDVVRVRVADNGPGAHSRAARGFGLTGLAERVQLQGGTLRTGPAAAGRGFALEVTLP